MSKWDKYAEPTGKWDKYAEKAAPSESGPGWFQPGSKSEAVVRGASQAATLGFGDEISAYLRALPAIGSKDGYLKTADELLTSDRAADRAALETNPGSYLAGSVGASIPTGVGIARAAAAAPTLVGKMGTAGALGSTLGAVQGAGNAETSADVLPMALKGAAIGGAVNAAVPGVAGALSKGGARGVTKLPDAMADKAGFVRKPGTAKVTTKKELLDTGAALAQGAAPSGGALIGAITGGLSEGSATDPVDSVGERLYNAAEGAAVGGVLGAAAKYGPAAGGRALYETGRGASSSFSQQAGGTLANQPFSKLLDYLTTAQGATNPKVEAAAAQAQEISEGDDEAKKRKAAMVLASDPTGRAVTNSTSPVRGN